MGEAEVDPENSLRYTFKVKDHITGEYEVIFTEDELASTDIGCKNATAFASNIPLSENLSLLVLEPNVNKIIVFSTVSGVLAAVTSHIEPNLIKSLMG